VIKTLGIIDGLLTTDYQRRHVSRSLGGKTVLEWVARQMTDSLRLDAVVVVTDHSEENMFVKMMTPLDVPVFMTNAADTMSALSKTLESFQAENCVYIGLDWPLIDSHLIDRLIIAAESNPNGHYAAFEFDSDSHQSGKDSRMGRPFGMFAEWYDVKALHRANRKATDPIHREFPGMYFLECADKTNLTLIPAPQPFCEHDLRLTFESEEDWDNITMIFDSIDTDNIHWYHIAELLLSLPQKGKIESKAGHTNSREIVSAT
jgi:spore coat polysaccharide biosynthesis protein SpsF (cytidylyltransferase family)